MFRNIRENVKKPEKLETTKIKEKRACILHYSITFYVLLLLYF